MCRYRRVVWTEGMLLTPHHFQQLDNYHEQLLSSRFASFTAYDWGVIDLQVNRESIANGYFDVLRCRAVTPDGLMINIPEIEQAPPPRPVEGHFDMDDDRLDVYLAVPARREGAINFQLSGADGGQIVRYLQDS